MYTDVLKNVKSCSVSKVPSNIYVSQNKVGLLIVCPDPVTAPPVEPKVVENNNRQYSVQALMMLADLIAPLLDVVYSSEEKDRVVPFLNSIMHHVFPYLRNHR